MKSNITFTVFITIIIFIIFFLLSFAPQGWQANLVSPFSGIVQVTPASPVPTSISSPSPKIFKFDSSTDLKYELETVNPQVLDSDFEE